MAETLHESPDFQKNGFTCHFCQAFAHMEWHDLLTSVYPGRTNSNNLNRTLQGNSRDQIYEATCARCRNQSYWIKVWETSLWSMVWPDSSLAPWPHAEMPEDAKQDYLEARSIVARSPRGAAALLRLTIQKLCKHLGEKGKSIDDDIGALVKKGLPIQVQQSLDSVRVIGNNAVHPGELSTEDVANVALALFDIVNFIVDDRIAKPKQLAELYDRLPSGARDSIKKRDL